MSARKKSPAKRNPLHHAIRPACRVRINVWNVNEERPQWYEMDARTFRVLLRYRDMAGRDFDRQAYQITRLDNDDATPQFTIYESGQIDVPASPMFVLDSVRPVTYIPVSPRDALCSCCGHPENSSTCQRSHA